MRNINFKVRNIGSEKYLSYILDDACDFDEELLDYLDENKIPELIDIIYEEDDEYDYLTYNVTGRTTVESLFENKVNAEKVLGIIRGVASGIVNMRDLGIPVSYVILHKAFTYVNPVTYDVKLLCIPVESDISLNYEFKSFIKNLLVNAVYEEAEDCNYVAKVINLLNVEKFSIRTFAGQITELMEAAGMQVEEDFMDVGDSGVEVSQSGDISVGDNTTIDDLPEFNDVSFDEEEDDGLDMYKDEPVQENTIFKDLDLDAEDETVSSGVNMSAFDDSILEELEIDEDIEETVDNEEIEEAGDDPANEDTLETAGSEEKITPEEKLQEEQVTEKTVEETHVTEVAKTTDGVTEIVPDVSDPLKPILIDTSDIDNLIDEPPVVKNIRINRAKIIQNAATDVEEETVDNPTEQIVASEFLENGGSVEPETIMAPVKEEKTAKRDEKDKAETAIELGAGMNVVKESEPEQHIASNVPKAMPFIVRVNTGERVMVNKAVFKLGKASRGVDFSISGNGAISRVHAIIYTREDGCYLKDNKATNPTYVDGKKLEEAQEVLLKNDATITLGGEDFLFKLS